MSSDTNGLPSPPSSPVDSKPPPTPPLPSASLFHNAPAEPDSEALHSLVQSMNSIRHSSAIDSLLTIAESHKRACEERDVHLRSTARLQTEKDALIEQIEKHKADVQSFKAQRLEAEKKLNDKAAGLEKDLQSKQASLDERDEELATCKKDLAAAEQNLNEARARAEAHEQAEGAALEAQKSLKKDLDELQKSFDEGKARLLEGIAELETMRSYYLPTTEMAPAEIGRVLDGIFNSAYNVVYACFSQDLSDGLFARAEPDQNETAATRAWDKFTSGIQAGTLGIPLPASNTPTAKTMRIVAVLRFLGLIASTELFQPVYMCDQGDDISNILARVKNPKLADAARRVLLQAIAEGRVVKENGEEEDDDDDDDDDDDNDDDDDEDDADAVADGDGGASDFGEDEGEGEGDENKSPSKLRAEGVVQEVLALVGGLLSPAQKKSFCTELVAWSYKTARIWENQLQPLSKRILARSLSRDDSDASLWSSLVYPSPPPPPPPPPSATRTGSFSGPRPPAARRGSVSVGSPPLALARPMQAPPKATPTAGGSAVAAVDLADVSLGIWPVFTLADNEETVVKRGLVVTKRQTAPASEEIQHAHAHRRSLRLLMRRPRRQSTVPPFVDASSTE